MTPFEKVIYRSKQQPLVPIGCLATTLAVILAAKGVRTGDAKGAQFWFRWRVGLQGLTLVALIAGSYMYDTQKKTAGKTEGQLAIEKAKMREKLWIEELEKRDAETKDRHRRAEMARQYQLEQQKKDLDN